MRFARHNPSVPGPHGGRRSKWEPAEEMLGDPVAGPRGEEDMGEEGAVLDRKSTRLNSSHAT